MQQTIINCKHCGKELNKIDKRFAEEYYDGLCSECSYLKCLNIYTIEDYNNYLKRIKDIK